MSIPRTICCEPLPDGSPCHACRIWDALTDAEAALDARAAEAGDFNNKRCVEGLADVLTYFLSSATEIEALEFITDVFMASRHVRREREREENPMAHPMGHA
jgi:hypothetical protein